MSTVEEILAKATETYSDRTLKYKNTWRPVADITKILYPNGITLKTSDDYAKFHILQWVIGKLVRYVQGNDDPDSIHDCGVYSFILEHIATETEKKNG